MNMDEFGKRLGLTSEQIQRIKTYWEKAEESEVKYCEDHSREYYDFEFEGICLFATKTSCIGNSSMATKRQEISSGEVDDLNSKKKNKNREEIMLALIVGGLVTLLVGYQYGIYQRQTAYGVTIPANGIMNVPGMPGTTIRAPPGSNVSNLTITHYGPNGSIVESNPMTPTIPATVIEPFMNLTNGTWTLYNGTSGSTSLMQFNHDGTYDRILHGNDWRGIWDASIVTEKVLQMCPTYSHPTRSDDDGGGGQVCDLIGLEPDTPNSIGFLDTYGHGMHLIRNDYNYNVPPPQTSALNQTIRSALLPFTNLAKGTWTLYNEFDGTTSHLQFNRDGTFSNNKVSDDGNGNLTGIWNTSIVTKEVLQICPTAPKLMSGCMLIGLKPDPNTPDQVGFMDNHGGTMYLRHDGNGGEIDR
jgi:hypothetical protein